MLRTTNEDSNTVDNAPVEVEWKEATDDDWDDDWGNDDNDWDDNNWDEEDDWDEETDTCNNEDINWDDDTEEGTKCL